ncbi:MAG: B12-binding domain-containing radical SAM protein [Spirochaetaceae bacterium]|nr:B12-binding domain-containing radical SAM protein [Spirochaetaceae bacterium]
MALRLLKANLGVYEPTAELREFALRQPLAEKTAPILAASPRILGVSVAIWNHRATAELLEALHGAWRSGAARRPFIILGGPEAAGINARSSLMDYADWIVQGEGEDCFRDLCAVLLPLAPGTRTEGIQERIVALPSVQGVEGKRITARAVRLSTLQRAYGLYTDTDLSRKLTYVEASRGCPWGCAFCQSALSTGVRTFPLDQVCEAVRELLDRGARSFKFLDRSFNSDIPRAIAIMEVFLRRLENAPVEPGKEPPFFVHFEMLPGRFPPQLRECLTRFPAGTLRVEIGIQTFNGETAARINRQSAPKRELKALAFLRDKTHAMVHADLIAGLPGEDLTSFAQGFDRLWGVRPKEIQLGILKCLPGTPLAQNHAAYGIRFNPDPPYEVWETEALSRRDMDRIKNFARFWERIVNREAVKELLPRLVPEGKRVFTAFMALSDWLWERFQRSWAIDRSDLDTALKEWLQREQEASGGNGYFG